MPSYKTAFGSYLKTEDLQGHAAKAVIESVEIEDVKGDDGVERKLIARFVGKEKALILNRTNCEMLDQIIGSDDYQAWVGHTVVLYPTTTKFGNKTVPCLRIRAVQQAHETPRVVRPTWKEVTATADAALTQPATVATGEINDSDIPF